MEGIPPNRILNYIPGTLTFLRDRYGFDSRERVNEAIDLLVEWVQKQKHFEKKDFDRGFLERLIIYNKGSVEKSKRKLDKVCTLRTFIPDYFAVRDIDKETFFGFYSDALLRNMTPDYDRVHVMKLGKGKLDAKVFSNYCRYFVSIYKYIQMMDVCNSVTLFVDWGDVSGLDYVMAISIADAQKALGIAYAGLSLRIKAMHMFSSSKSLTAFITLLKQTVSEKLGGRVYVHKTLESVLEYIPREILPKDYGGDDKPMAELREELFNEITSVEFSEYRREMNKGRTNETLRNIDTFNEEYLGIPGTFRNLRVD